MTRKKPTLSATSPRPWRPVLFRGVHFASLRTSASGAVYADSTQPHWWERPAVKSLPIEDRARIREALAVLRGWSVFDALPGALGDGFELGEMSHA